MVLAHKVAITLEACHAKEIIEQAFARYGLPEIVNTDQGSQFTPEEFTNAVLSRGCKLSMDGKGAWRDNVFVERLWRWANTSVFTCGPMAQLVKQRLTLPSTSIGTTANGCIQALRTDHQSKPIWSYYPRSPRLHKMKIPDAPRVAHSCRRGQLCINSTRPQYLYLLG